MGHKQGQWANKLGQLFPSLSDFVAQYSLMTQNEQHSCMHLLLYSLVILCEHIFGASYSLKCMKYLSQYQSKPIPDKVQRNIFKVVRINSRRESEQSQEAWGNGNSTFRQLKMWGFSQMNQLEPDTTSFLSTSEVTPKDTLRNGSHN